MEPPGVTDSTQNKIDEEAAIYSLTQALTDPELLKVNQEAGCFRNEAALIPFMVSDEADICYSPNYIFGELPQHNFRFDNRFFLGNKNFLEFPLFVGDDVEDHAEINEGLRAAHDAARPHPLYAGMPEEALYRKDFCTDGVLDPETNMYQNNITHETLIERLKGYNGVLSTSGGAVGYFPEKTPTYVPSLTNHAEPYWGGKEFAASLGQEMVDLSLTEKSQDAFNAGMNKMIEGVVIDLSYFSEFSLPTKMCDVNQDGRYTDEDIWVTVKVGGQKVPDDQWRINEDGTAIMFNEDYDWSAQHDSWNSNQEQEAIKSELKVEVSYVRCDNNS